MAKILSFWESLGILKKHGIKVVPTTLVDDFEKAVEFANEFGFPLVAKVSSPDVTHKSDVGGVVVNVTDEIELMNAIESIKRNVKKRMPTARIEGVAIQKMVKGVEVIIGGIVDPTFGSCVSFGSGGIFTEIYGDVSFRVVPITRNDAKEMIKETKIYGVLKGYRNVPKSNIKSLVRLLLKVSKMMEKMPEIKELDLNPVFATPKESLVADVRIVVE